MKCGPDECPIVAFSDLTPAEQRVQRKRTAIKMTEQGFTEQQIAKQLGVSQQTISSDLGNLPETGKSKPAKTASNPKGAGRPKGRKGAAKPRNQTVPDEERPKLAAAVLDHGKTVKQVADEAGVSDQIVKTSVEREKGRREAEPLIDPSTLSISAQHKFDLAMRRHQRELDLAFEHRVQTEINQRLDHIILPVWRKKIADAKKIYDVRRAITNKETFNIILKCLHADTRRHITDAIANEAFTRFMALEKYLLNEKDSPTPFVGLPTTAAESEQRKQQATALRRAKRGHANVQRTTI